MNWKRRARRYLLFAGVGGVAATALYFGLLFTKTLHGLAASALGPANSVIWNLDPNCYAGSRCYLEELPVNVALYALWIFVILIAIDLLLQLKRKLKP